MTVASAPGKIILFGEHAVVYGRPAIAVPVTQVHADVEVAESSRPGIWIHAPNVDLDAELNTLPSDHPLAAVIHNLFFSLGISPHPLPSPTGRGSKGEGLDITINSTIPVASGLGSGAAVSVALVRALSSALGRPLSDDQVNAFAYEIERLHHGTPSGIDNTVITYASPVYFIKGHPIETLKVGRPFTLVIGDTGIPAPTKQSVGDVRRLWTKNNLRMEQVFDEVSQISLMARRIIESGQPEMLGDLMNQNHAFLQEMTVSSQELDTLVRAARAAGALGAKMSGGGRGGNMIALVDEANQDAVVAALIAAGATKVIVTVISGQ